jgi:hypothetical protein
VVGDDGNGPKRCEMRRLGPSVYFIFVFFYVLTTVFIILCSIYVPGGFGG